MFLAALTKEFKLVFRDLHSVLVLFFMPAAFIIIMSLALQDQFSTNDSATIKIFYNFEDESERDSQSVKKFLSVLTSSPYFRFVEADSVGSSDQETIRLLGETSRALVTIATGFSEALEETPVGSQSIRLSVSPSIDSRNKLLLEALLGGALIEAKLELMLPANMTADKDQTLMLDDAIVTTYLTGSEKDSVSPTAVQQNVPAWLIFSMFFVVIPVATTLISERQQGTLARLRTMNISIPLFLIAKALPYLLINQLQLIIMLLLGVYGVPLLGGDSLHIGSQYAALALMSLAIGFSAIGYALLVAVLAKTTAQAASIGGVGNILLGAIGGIMVPKFIMPDYLQPFTQLSPMSWGLDGFLELFLYQNGISAVVSEVLMLVAFGIIMFTVAIALFNRRALA